MFSIINKNEWDIHGYFYKTRDSTYGIKSIGYKNQKKISICTIDSNYIWSYRDEKGLIQKLNKGLTISNPNYYYVFDFGNIL